MAGRMAKLVGPKVKSGGHGHILGAFHLTVIDSRGRKKTAQMSKITRHLMPCMLVLLHVQQNLMFTSKTSLVLREQIMRITGLKFGF